MKPPRGDDTPASYGDDTPPDPILELDAARAELAAAQVAYAKARAAAAATLDGVGRIGLAHGELVRARAELTRSQTELASERAAAGIDELVVISTGIDTLRLTATAELSEDRMRYFDDKKESAALGSQEIIPVAGHAVEVRRHGVKGYPWHFYVRRAGLDQVCSVISLTHRREFPTVKIEIRAAELWSLGTRLAASNAANVVAELLHRRFLPSLHVSRVDFTLDHQGFDLEPGFDELMVTRAKRRRSYVEPYEGCADCAAPWITSSPACVNPKCRAPRRRPGELVDACAACGAYWSELRCPCREPRRVQIREVRTNPIPGPFRVKPEPVGVAPFTPFRDGLRVTGASWGIGKTVFARWYNKTWEMRNKPMRNFWPVIWAENARRRGVEYHAGRPVMRLEFQLARAFLRTLKLGRYGARVDLLDEMLAAQNTIVRYLVGEPDSLDADGKPNRRATGWLEMRRPIVGARGALVERKSWPVTPAWRAIQSTKFVNNTETPLPVARENLEEGNTELLAKQAYGVLGNYFSRGELVRFGADDSVSDEKLAEMVFSRGTEQLRAHVEKGKPRLILQKMRKLDEKRGAFNAATAKRNREIAVDRRILAERVAAVERAENEHERAKRLKREREKTRA